MEDDLILSAFITESIGLDITAIEATTIAAVQSQVDLALKDGLSVESLRQSIADVFDGFSQTRALTIARTEVGSAASFGQMVGAVASGATTKVWLTSRDSHVRGNHDHMEQEAVPINNTFSNGGRFPSDPSLSAGERINCRCAMSFR